MATYLPTMLIGTSRDQVLKELRRRSAAGELHSAGPGVVAITRGPHAGHYGIPIYLIATEPRPRSSRRQVVIGVGVTLAALAGLTWWVLSTLSAAALASLLLGILATFMYGVRRATRVEVVTTTTTRVTVR